MVPIKINHMFLWFWVKSFFNCIFLIWKKNIFDWKYLIGLKPLSEEYDPLRFIQSLLGPYNSSKGKSTNCAWSWLAKWCASRQKDSSDVFATTFVWRKKCILERASNHYAALTPIARWVLDILSVAVVPANSKTLVPFSKKYRIRFIWNLLLLKIFRTLVKGIQNRWKLLSRFHELPLFLKLNSKRLQG